MNVIPSEAEATIDIRALPDENIDDFFAQLLGVVNDPAIEIAPLLNYRHPAPPSRMDNEMFRALEGVTKRMFPGAITLPSMLTGATDMSQLRAKGVEAYGFGSIRSEEDLSKGGGAHGDDERVAEESVVKLVQFLWYAVLEVAGAESVEGQ